MPAWSPKSLAEISAQTGAIHKGKKRQKQMDVVSLNRCRFGQTVPLKVSPGGTIFGLFLATHIPK
ncbi:MAG: hypothetical protein CSA33_04665 [Desulfobulbus propionicus]|nr:MAG: hypothetical protein CSA33_04665 [Desulfobulbus propionicus]